jgi:hypothetical protein
VAQSLEQRLCAVVEVLSKFRQHTLSHFVDRQLTGEISADPHELDQGLDFSNFIWIQHRNLAGFLAMAAAAAVAARDRGLILFRSEADRKSANTLRSSSPTSSERAPGESSRRNFRSRSTVVSAPAILSLSESKPFGLIRRRPLRLC